MSDLEAAVIVQVFRHDPQEGYNIPKVRFYATLAEEREVDRFIEGLDPPPKGRDRAAEGR